MPVRGNFIPLGRSLTIQSGQPWAALLRIDGEPVHPMTHRVVPNTLSSLSYGQLFLFQKKAHKEPVLYRPRNQRKHSPGFKLWNIALAGLLLGFTLSLLVQSFRP